MQQSCQEGLNGIESGEIEPLPKPLKHTGKRPLKQIGMPCPYCHGTTGFHPFDKLIICYSCDYTWSLTGEPLGVIENVGVMR